MHPTRPAGARPERRDPLRAGPAARPGSPGGARARPAPVRAGERREVRPSCGSGPAGPRPAAAAALAACLLLPGCGGDGRGTGIPGAAPAPGTATHHAVSTALPPGPYAFSGALVDAVRIGIEDTPVAFTHPVFHGRVRLEGASLVYWRPLASQAAQAAFASCGADGLPCRIFRVDSRGDDARLQDLARTVIEHAGLPVANNRWFLHDRSRGERGWYELPSVEDLEHGTRVALVAMGRRFHPFPAPDPVIVPMAFNFDEQLEGQHYFSDLVAASRSDPRTLNELDERESERIRGQHEAADIINASYGTSVDLNSLGGRNVLGTWRDDLELLRERSPLTWGEYTQARTHAPERRTIRVWAAGNHDPGTGIPASGSEGHWYDEFPNVLAGDGYRNLDSLGPYWFSALRGQHIRVTALGAGEQRLAAYADPCGPLPEDWDAAADARYGRHHCLAAPGTLRDGAEGTSFAAPFVSAEGTSFAAPFVSGVLARMLRRFPGVAPRELVRKLMDTADGYREDGFDGGIYVVQHQRRSPGDPDDLVDRIVELDGDDRFRTTLTLETPDPTLPAPREGEFRVVQRGCTPQGSDHLVWTGEAADSCVVWRSSEPGEAADALAEDDDLFPFFLDARAKARERFEFVYGAGRVDADAALAPVGPTRVSAPGGPSAPVSSTRLRAPAAWGAIGDRAAGLSLAAFDALDFPFFHDLGGFVADEGAGGASPIPDFLPEPARTRACDPLRELAPGLLCTARADDASVRALASPDGAGAALRLGNDLLLSGFTRQRGRLDGAGSGAFSFAGGSSLAALHLDRAWSPEASERWRLEGSLTLAADLPRGLGVSAPSLFTAGTTVLSEWRLGLTRTSGATRTRLSLAQPPRAEAGTGRFTVPGGRREDGARVYETHRVSLVPSHREVTLRIAHQRPVRSGELVLSVHRTENRGHRAARPVHGAGLAYRTRW